MPLTISGHHSPQVLLSLNSITLSFFQQLAFTMVVYPSLILAYMGQAAYISQHHSFEKNHHIGFYVSVPGTIILPC